MSEDFEVVESSRLDEVEKVDGEVVELRTKHECSEGVNNVLNAVADNFPRMLDLAGELVEIKNIKEQTEATIALSEEKRKAIQQEADIYIKNLQEKNNFILSKAQIIRMMMQDFYKNNHGELSGEEFSAIIQSMIENMGKNNEQE